MSDSPEGQEDQLAGLDGFVAALESATNLFSRMPAYSLMTAGIILALAPLGLRLWGGGLESIEFEASLVAGVAFLLIGTVLYVSDNGLRTESMKQIGRLHFPVRKGNRASGN